jgi:hypothetical protein
MSPTIQRARSIRWLPRSAIVVPPSSRSKRQSNPVAGSVNSSDSQVARQSLMIADGAVGDHPVHESYRRELAVVEADGVMDARRPDRVRGRAGLVVGDSTSSRVMRSRQSVTVAGTP